MIWSWDGGQWRSGPNLISTQPPLGAARPFHMMEETLHDAGAFAAIHKQDLGIPEYSFRALLTSSESNFLAQQPSGSQFFYYATPYDLAGDWVEDPIIHAQTRDANYRTSMAPGLVNLYGIADMYLLGFPEWDNDPGNRLWAQNRFLEAGSTAAPNHPTTAMTRQQIYDQWNHFYLAANHDGNLNHHQLGSLINVPYTTRGFKTVSMNVFAGNCHFAYEQGMDQVILERNNDDISGLVGGLALIRGAGTQYGRKWGIDMSASRTNGPLAGVTAYSGSTLISGWSNSNYRRHFYLTFFGGADTLFMEGVSYEAGGTVNINGRFYIPTATEIKNFTNFAYTRHPQRGVAWAPIAIMKDHIVQWEPRWGLWMQSRNVWYGQIPPNAGENMMHSLYDTIYPGYNNWGSSTSTTEPWGNGKWGEQFDVITERITSIPTANYGAVIVSMNTPMDATLQATLTAFATAGGVVVLNAKQLTGTAHSTLTGITITGSASTSGTLTWELDGTTTTEPAFNYSTVTLGTATRIAHTGTVTPQVTQNLIGSGKVWTVLPDWMSNASNTALLGLGSKIIDSLITSFLVGKVSGGNHANIDYAITRKAGASGLANVMMIMNNDASTTWTGTVSLPQGTPIREWVGDTTPTSSNSGGLTNITASVAAGDVRVYAVG